MNCLYETIAGVYVRARGRIMPPAEDDLGDAEENLESCRSSLVARERDLVAKADKLAKHALDLAPPVAGPCAKHIPIAVG